MVEDNQRIRGCSAVRVPASHLCLGSYRCWPSERPPIFEGCSWPLCSPTDPALFTANGHDPSGTLGLQIQGLSSCKTMCGSIWKAWGRSCDSLGSLCSALMVLSDWWLNNQQHSPWLRGTRASAEHHLKARLMFA